MDQVNKDTLIIDAGFHPIACWLFRAQTKGCVEALARTMGRLKPYDGEFGTINDLNDISQTPKSREVTKQ